MVLLFVLQKRKLRNKAAKYSKSLGLNEHPDVDSQKYKALLKSYLEYELGAERAKLRDIAMDIGLYQYYLKDTRDITSFSSAVFG